jgi:hypothetical protein
MSLRLAEAIVAMSELYAIAGFLFAAIFLARGVTKVDPRTAAAPKTLRLLILPGVAAFWPLFARRWFSGTRELVERNPHRDKAMRASVEATKVPR